MRQILILLLAFEITLAEASINAATINVTETVVIDFSQMKKQLKFLTFNNGTLDSCLSSTFKKLRHSEFRHVPIRSLLEPTGYSYVFPSINTQTLMPVLIKRNEENKPQDMQLYLVLLNKSELSEYEAKVCLYSTNNGANLPQEIIDNLFDELIRQDYSKDKVPYSLLALIKTELLLGNYKKPNSLSPEHTDFSILSEFIKGYKAANNCNCNDPWYYFREFNKKANGPMDLKKNMTTIQDQHKIYKFKKKHPIEFYFSEIIAGADSLLMYKNDKLKYEGKIENCSAKLKKSIDTIAFLIPNDNNRSIRKWKKNSLNRNEQIFSFIKSISKVNNDSPDTQNENIYSLLDQFNGVVINEENAIKYKMVRNDIIESDKDVQKNIGDLISFDGYKPNPGEFVYPLNIMSLSKISNSIAYGPRILMEVPLKIRVFDDLNSPGKFTIKLLEDSNRCIVSDIFFKPGQYHSNFEHVVTLFINEFNKWLIKYSMKTGKTYEQEVTISGMADSLRFKRNLTLPNNIEMKYQNDTIFLASHHQKYRFGDLYNSTNFTVSYKNNVLLSYLRARTLYDELVSNNLTFKKIDISCYYKETESSIWKRNCSVSLKIIQKNK
jgi:hypothetical protein